MLPDVSDSSKVSITHNSNLIRYKGHTNAESLSRFQEELKSFGGRAINPVLTPRLKPARS